MNVLITGAAGNLGSALARHLLRTQHRLFLLVHRTPLPVSLTGPAETAGGTVTVIKADLSDPVSLVDACRNIDCIVHLAGVLFRPQPAKFLHVTNTLYVRNLVDAALPAGVRKFILVSFPHVEGETTPMSRARGSLEATPNAIHSRTRLEAEKYLFHSTAMNTMQPIVFRAGVIYGPDVKLIKAARRLMSMRLLAIWNQPTWLHLLALPDFLRIVEVGIENDRLSGIYNLCDDEPLLIQDFLDRLATHWGYRRVWRLPSFMFYLATMFSEAFATLFRTPAPLTRDIITMGMTSVVADTSRMKKEILSDLRYPSFRQGIVLL